MNIAFRVDSSAAMGIGHAMRCLALSQELRAQGAKTYFISRAHVGNINQHVAEHTNVLCELSPPIVDWEGDDTYQTWLGVSPERDFAECADVVMKLPTLDWLVVDHYGLDRSWHQAMKKLGPRLMVIDDLANRPYGADILLDQTYQCELSDYQPHVNNECELLLGTTYALLRPEFARLRAEVLSERQLRSKPQQILVSFGGSDPYRLNEKVIDAIFSLKEMGPLVIDLVVGHNKLYYAELETKLKSIANLSSHQFNLIGNANNMAELISAADLAIGAAGSSSWERCCLALPTLQVITAENQSCIARRLASHGATKLLGAAEMVHTEELKQSIEALLCDPTLLKKMSECAAQVCDGIGVQRVANKLLRDM